MRNSKSVIICGGGIIGLCTAYYLAREGAGVTLIERHGAERDHCALGSTGFVSPSHVRPFAAPGMAWRGLKSVADSRSPFYVRPRFDTDLLRWGWLFWRAGTRRRVERAAPVLRDLCLASRRLYVELDEILGGSFELKQEGLLNLCRTPEALEREAAGLARLANEVGIEARVLDAAHAAAVEPGVKMNIAGAIYFPGDAHLTPALLARGLTSLLTEMGVKFLWNTTVFDWSAHGGRISTVNTTAGALVADEFVLTGGSWSPTMLARLGLRLPMQPGKGYSLTLERPRFHLSKSIILTERRVAVTPMGGRLRIGGTMELGGHDEKIRGERVAQIVAAAREYFPEMIATDFAETAPWFGYRPMSPDGLPFLGRFRRYQNLTCAAGHAMLGVTLAPVTGLLVADLLAGRRPSVDLSLLRPDRYS